MKRVTLFVLLFALFVIPPAQARWSPGENLLTSFIPSTEEWEAFEKNEGGVHTEEWRKRGHGRSDRYAVSVMPGLKEELSVFREAMDAPGKEGCRTFESEVLNQSPTNGYSKLIWRTRCFDKDGLRATLLLVAIQGRDSFYYLMRVWHGDVPEQEMGFWQERLSLTSVCDTRDPDRPCPEGFIRVR